MAARDVLERYRADLQDLSALAARDVSLLLSELRGSPIGEVREILTAVLPDLVEPFLGASGELAATWYEDLRAASAVRGTFYAEAAASAIPAGKAERLARWAVAPLVADESATSDVLSRLSGAVQRAVFDAGRDTVVSNTRRDPVRVGWQRMARPGSCAFCSMLASRGAAYESQASASRTSSGERYHDHCHCVATPIFEGTEIAEIAQADQAQFTAMYEQARREATSGRTSDVLSAWRAVHGTH